MKSANRRVFMMQVVAVGSALAATGAQAQAKLEETDAQATSLGYKHDATKVAGIIQMVNKRAMEWGSVTQA